MAQQLWGCGCVMATLCTCFPVWCPDNARARVNVLRLADSRRFRFYFLIACEGAVTASVHIHATCKLLQFEDALAGPAFPQCQI